MPVTSEARGLPVWVGVHLQGPCQDLGMPHFAAVACATDVAVEASVARRPQLAVVQDCLENSAVGQVAPLVGGLLGEFACYLADPCNLAAVEMEHDWPTVAAAAATVVAFSLPAL